MLTKIMNAKILFGGSIKKMAKYLSLISNCYQKWTRFTTPKYVELHETVSLLIKQLVIWNCYLFSILELYTCFLV